MKTTTFRAATLFQLFFVIVSAFVCGCGTNPQPSGGDGGVAIGPADAPGTLLSTVDDPQFGTYQLIARGDDQESGKWTFLVQATRGGTKGQLRFVWDFGNGPEAEGTQQTYSFTSNGTYAITVTALQADKSVAFVLKLTIEVVVDPNLAPVADSGADQIVNANDLVFLFGGNSSDPNNDEITYEWSQTFGPAVGILHSAEPSASFVAPLVDLDTDLVFRLTVSDGVAAGHDDVIVHVTPLSVPAGIGLAANAGADQQIGPRTTVTLSGSATPANPTTTFVWTQRQGPSVTLSGANRATATFVAPAVAATLGFELAVTQQDAIATDEILVTVDGGGTADPCAIDTDHDGLYDCVAGCPATNCDQCPNDPGKGAPQQCGCGVPDTDANGNGTPDCLETLDCVTSTPGWTNSSFLAQSGVFTAQFDATPNVSLMDGTIGLSQGAGSTFSNFAVLVRFNPSGTIDARNGGSYGAATTIPYAANQQFHFRLVVSVPAHTYDTYVTPQGGAEVQLGRGYAFRTEQNAVTSLNNLGVGAAIGTMLQVCGLAISGPEPVANAGADVTIVMGGSTPLSGSATGGTPPYTYLWSPSTGLTNVNVQNPTASPGATTAYSLLVTDSLGATASDTVTVTVQAGQTVVPLVANAGADRTIAAGGSVVLSGSATGGTPPYTYSWSPATGLNNPSIASPTASPTITTTYTLTVTDSQSRTATDTMQTVVTLVANAGPDQSITSGGSVALSGSARGGTPPYVYVWSPTTGLNNANIATPTASPSDPTTYKLTVTDSQSRTATDSAIVTVTGVTTTGNVIYVSTTGNDANPGSEVLPYRTPQRAFDMAQPGDTVLIKAGIYYPYQWGGTKNWGGAIGLSGGIIMNRGGTAANPIYIEPYQNDLVIFDGQKQAYSGFQVRQDGLNGRSTSEVGHIIIGNAQRKVGFVLRNFTRAAINLMGIYPEGGFSNVHNIEINYCLMHDIDNGASATGLYCGGTSYVHVRRCISHSSNRGFQFGVHANPRDPMIANSFVTIEYSLAYNIFDPLGGGENAEGFQFSGFNDNFLAHHNVAYECSDMGFGGLENINGKLEYNVVYNSNLQNSVSGDGHGFKLGVDFARDLTFRSNIVFGCQNSAFNGAIETGSIYANNVAYNNGRTGLGGQDRAFNGMNLSRLLNNIALANGGDRDYQGQESYPSNVVDYCYWGNSGQGKVGVHDILAASGGDVFVSPDSPGVVIDILAPDFADAPGFRLSAGSPAIDAGTFATATAINGVATAQISTTDDPRRLFSIGELIQVAGAGRATILSLSPTTITVNVPLTFFAGAGVHWPWNGAAPDLGPYEY